MSRKPGLSFSMYGSSTGQSGFIFFRSRNTLAPHYTNTLAPHYTNTLAPHYTNTHHIALIHTQTKDATYTQAHLTHTHCTQAPHYTHTLHT